MQKLLFFDDIPFTRLRNVARRFHQPRWLDDAAFRDLHCRLGIGYGSVCPAPDHGYFLYYITVLKGNRKALGLARSDDGIHWRSEHFDPPAFDDYPHAVYPADGLPHGSGISVYHDPNDPDPDKRYKLLDPVFLTPRQISMAYSPDGLHWTRRDDHLVFPGDSDTMLSLLRNHRSGRYQVHLRAWIGDRRIFRIESDDCVRWSPPQLVLQPGPTDPLMTQFYGMPQFRYGDRFLGFLWNYRTPFDTPHHHKHTGRVETELVYSLDGLTWNRTHQSFMPRREWGQIGGGEQYGTALLDRGDDVLVYSSTNLDEHHNVSNKAGEGAMILLTGVMRRDGFVGLTTDAGGPGEIYTDCLHLRSPQLTLNATAPRGGIRVAVCDTLCNPLPGFTLDDAIPLTGDSLILRPQWREHADMSAALALLEKTDTPGWGRLHIELDRAEIFAVESDFGHHLRSGGRGQDWM